MEAITHPAIAKRAEEELLRLRTSGAPVVVYMAPLLIEAGATSRVDEVWVVYVDRETQLQRIMARDKVSKAESEQRIAAQMPMETKKLHGSVVIDNRDPLEELEAKVKELLGEGSSTEMKGESGGPVEGPFLFVVSQLCRNFFRGLNNKRNEFFFEPCIGESHGGA